MVSMLATHPPLKERIKRIDPSFDGNFKAFVPAPKPAPETAKAAAKKKPAKKKKASSYRGLIARASSRSAGH